PYVAGDVIQTVAVRRELRDRPDADERVVAGVAIRKMPLVRVGHRVAILLERVAPRIELPAQAAARGELPLRFCRQTLARPFHVGERILVRDVDDGELLFFGD